MLGRVSAAGETIGDTRRNNIRKKQLLVFMLIPDSSSLLLIASELSFSGAYFCCYFRDVPSLGSGLFFAILFVV